MLSNMPFTVTAAVCVIVAVLAITVVFCTALIRALPADVPRIMEPFGQLLAAIVKVLTHRKNDRRGDDEGGEL